VRSDDRKMVLLAIALFLALAAIGWALSHISSRIAIYLTLLSATGATIGVLHWIDPFNELVRSLATAGDRAGAKDALKRYAARRWAIRFPDSATRARWALIFDFHFIMTYTVAIGLGCWVSPQVDPRFQVVQMLTVAIVAVSLIDIVENSTLLALLAGRRVDTLMKPLPWLFRVKMITWSVGALVALVSGAFWAFG